MTNSSLAYIRRLAGLAGFTVLTSMLALGPAVAQEERQSLQGRSLEQRTGEPGRASAAAEQQIAGPWPRLWRIRTTRASAGRLASRTWAMRLSVVSR